MIDIVIPNNNEKEFISVAEKLGFTGLLFLYSQREHSKKEINYKTKLKISKGILANPKQLQRNSSMYKSKSMFVVVKSSEDDRTIIDSHQADLIFDVESGRNRDFIHHRASGLNHIMANKMNENKMQLGLSVSTLINTTNRSKQFGRIIQNIELCKKYNVKMRVASFASNPFDMRSPKDIQSLFQILGMRFSSK